MPQIDPDSLSPAVHGQARDPLDLLLVDEMSLYLIGKSDRIIWEVGDTWVIKDHSGWMIGADESATDDDVRELLKRNGGIATLLETNNYPTGKETSE